MITSFASAALPEDDKKSDGAADEHGYSGVLVVCVGVVVVRGAGAVELARYGWLVRWHIRERFVAVPEGAHGERLEYATGKRAN